jgi:DNA-binding CsgD family transcriptional regulator
MSPLPRPRPDSLNNSNFDLTPELEAMFNALALAGREDPAARNELYARLSGKIARFLAPWYERQTALGDFADLRQEAFIVFANLVLGWSGEGSFARYFLAFFPWRMRHAIAYHERRWGARRLLIVPEGQIDRLGSDEAELGEDAEMLLGALTEKERQLLALRLAGYSLPAAATRLGWGERTAARRWRALRRRLGVSRE